MTSAEPPLGRRTPASWVLAGVWVALSIGVIAVARTLPWGRVVERIGTVQWYWLAAAVCAYALVLVIWAAEWRILAPGTEKVAYGRMFDVVTTMAAVLNSVPFFAGEASGVAMLMMRAGLKRGAALSVLALDQLLAGLVKLVVLGAAAMLVPLPAWLRTGLLALVGGSGLLLIVLLPLAHRWEAMHDRLRRLPGRVAHALAAIVSWGRHLDALRETHRAWRVSFLALGRKLVELLAILAVQMAFGLTPSFSAAVLVLAALAIATLLPVAPANLGLYEAAVFAAYRYVGTPTDTALGMALVQHVCFLLPMLATGYVTLTIRQVLPRQRTA